MQTVAVLGAGTMGHGIAHVCALAGLDVVLADANPEVLALAPGRIRANLDKGVDKGKVSAEARDAALSRLRTVPTVGRAAEGADIVIEAVPENLDLKRSLLAQAEQAAGPGAILASNTSSLSIDRIAEALDLPARFLGMHFFNPVHVMALLEVVAGTATAPEVVEQVRALGARLGKEVIVVRDAPGFATSRLGVCLGMEAIRMVEEGVASPADIDKAMVLGYRHPIGPLRLTDLVGLDVRMAIGTYLAAELGNPAFEPPALMQRMVAEGRLGQKSGHGFYDW
ncbi:MAG: 3-hydroxyacyl-CoA dehydrogenase family protein [Alphaproteobacteria bacterium]|nr:3-hydroxyacyl-CoA dehydrogenase family protein [Alphaproteobacteria bacterium]